MLLTLHHAHAWDVTTAQAIEIQKRLAGLVAQTPLAETPLLEDRSVYYKTIALLRLLNPAAHIPATTAYDALFPNGRELALQRGANVFMPNATPGPLRKNYLLYPGKPCVDEDAADCTLCVAARLRALIRAFR